MFARGGPTIRHADVTDGTSNTLLLGETLPEFCEFQRYNGGGRVGQVATLLLKARPFNRSIGRSIA